MYIFLRKKNTIKHTWELFIGVGLPILGIYLAWTANNIAKASYALSQSDSSLEVQIRQLSKVIDYQKTQIDTLISIAFKLSKQNKLTSEQNVELISQGKHLEKQLAITQKQQLENLSNRFLQRKGYCTRVYKTYNELLRLSLNGKKMSEYDQTDRLNFLKRCYSLLESELQNEYLLENYSSFETWHNFFRIVRSEITSAEMNLPLVIVDTKGQHAASPEELISYKNLLWERFTQNYEKFLMIEETIARDAKRFGISLAMPSLPDK